MKMTLKEMANQYSGLYSDVKIIETFFSENGMIDEAINMLVRLSAEKVKAYQRKISNMLFHMEIIDLILVNEGIEEEDKLHLMKLCETFAFYRDLTHEEKVSAKKIIKAHGEPMLCPRYFKAYVSDSIESLEDYDKRELEELIELRDME